MSKKITVDEYIEKHPKWEPSLKLFREIVSNTELSETIKWGAPYYTLEGKNVLGFAAFKNHVAIWFTQGALLDDPENRLVNAQEGKTKAGRQLRFTSNEEADAKIITGFINQAIENQKAGKEIKPATNKSLNIPDELLGAFHEYPGLEDKFDSFTMYKQREFAEYIIEAKQEATKKRRLTKIIPMIKNGIGLHDKYR